MARIRTLKPSFWTAPRVILLGRDARLLAVGMITLCADDEGRFIASPRALLGAVYPHDNLTARQVERWRDEVASTGLIELYEVGKATYGWFPRWRKHQRISHPTPSTLPAPPRPPTSGELPEQRPSDARGAPQALRPDLEKEGEKEVEVTPTTHLARPA